MPRGWSVRECINSTARLGHIFFSMWLVFTLPPLNQFIAKGTGNIPSSGGVLFTANHISAYETIFLPWAIVRHHPFQMVWAPAKQELFARTIPRLFYSSWGAFPVKRGRDIKANRVIENILKDQKVMLFPEGTRHKDGRLGKGNRGVGKIIHEIRPVVIPTALIGLNRWKFPGFATISDSCFRKTA